MLESSRTLASRIFNGAQIALAPDYSGCSIALVKEIIKSGVRDLHLIGCPQLGLQAELLVAGGCVARIETAAFGLGESGRAPAFDRAYHRGQIEVLESTCPAIHSGLQAAEKGLPFMPINSVLGSDLVQARPDWRIIQDPYSAKEILTVPAIRPDFALFHAPLADPNRAVWIGVRRELMLMAHAAKSSFVSVEEIHGSSLIEDPALASGTIPDLYITGLAHCPGGARPGGLFNRYEPDLAWLANYLQAAKDETRLAEFMQAWLAA